MNCANLRLLNSERGRLKVGNLKIDLLRLN